MHFLIKNKSQLLKALEKFTTNNYTRVLVLVSEQAKYDFINEHLEVINSYKIEIFGGVFPSLIFDSEPSEDGLIMISSPNIINAILLPLESDSVFLNKQIESFRSNLNHIAIESIFTLVSAFGSDKTPFLRNVYDIFGNTVNYFGAGCGSITNKPGYSILNNKGYTANAGLIIALKSKLEINYTHGWNSLDSIYKVTECVDNEIISIDWKPAFQVYKKIIKEEFGEEIDNNNFFEVAKNYPFGILRLDRELIIRDPYAITNRDGILVLDKIDEGEFIKIMYGTSEDLINATKPIWFDNSNCIFCFNCISRKLLHEENITIEIKKINPKKVLGAFSIGEIINQGDSYLEMSNKIIITSKC